MDEKKISGFIGGIVVGVLVATIGFSFYVMKKNSDPEASKEKKLVLKLAHSLDPQHPVHIAMEHMKKRLEEISGGKASLDIYPSGVLGSETNCIEQLQNGTLAMTKTSAAPMEGFIPEMAVFGLPYVFRDSDHYWKVLDSQLGKDLLDKGQSKNLLGLCYYDAGSRNFYTKEKAVESPDDLKGLKIRVMNSKTAMDMVTALGAAPTPISWGELYTSLQQGVVDGAENNPPSYYTNRHHEVCKFFSMDGHTRIPDMLLISSKVWKKLPENVREWVQKAADDSSVFQRDLWKKKTEAALADAEKDGVKVIYPDQKPFVEKVQPMLKSYEGTPVGELLNKIKGM
jgi:tripartite ATP-independent transporter DctP family solute receptor